MVLAKLGMSLLASLICLWPLWCYLIANAVFSPEGFWQKLVLVGVGVYALGGFQLFFGGILLYVLFKIWFDD